MKITETLAIAAAILFASTAAAAQKDPQLPLVRSLVDCQRQSDDAARLRCYDAAVTALSEATTSGKVVMVDREDVRKTRRSLFGFGLPKLPFFRGDNSSEDQQDELTAKVASAGSVGYGKYRIKLEDGALWETTESSAMIKGPDAGDTVVIKKGPLGSYMIRIAGQRALRAKRVG